MTGDRASTEAAFLAAIRAQVDAGVLVRVGVDDMPALCRYPAHRSSDWVGPSGKVICAVCHPRAAQ